MENFLKEELKLAQKALMQAKSEEEYINIIDAINNIHNIQDDFFINKQNTVNAKKYCQLGTENPTAEYLMFITQLIDIYADMPLLETESYIDYPILKSNKSTPVSTILNFWNYVLSTEMSTLNMPLLTIKNVAFIDCSAIKRILTNGKCTVYHSFQSQQPKLILKRFYNIKDFMIPCGSAMMMSPNINQLNDNGIINTMQYYIITKALHMYQELNNREAVNLKLIINDNLIYEARALRKLINLGWNNLSIFYKGKILDFADHIIGMMLSEKNDTTLDMLLSQYFGNNQSISHLISYNEIIENTKKLSLNYKQNELRK